MILSYLFYHTSTGHVYRIPNDEIIMEPDHPASGRMLALTAMAITITMVGLSFPQTLNRSSVVMAASH
jgi:hypothetical protein